MITKCITFFITFFLLTAFINIYSQSVKIMSVSPRQNEIGTPGELVIEVKLYDALDSSSISNNLFNVFGKNSNIHSGKVIYEKENKLVKFIPDNNFFAGEVVKICFGPVITLSGEIIKAYNWQFTVGITNRTNAKFKLPVEIPLNTQYLHAIDIDKNGTIDLVSIEGNVMYNQGDGTFSEPVYESKYEGTTFFCDLNNDTNPDIIKDYYDYSTVSVCNKNGQYEVLDTLEGDYSNIYDIGDLNNDGFIDLIGTGYGWKILFNDGKGHFKEDSLAYKDAECFTDMGILDINNDGIFENVILVMNALGCENDFNGILVYSNNTNGYFNSFDKYKSTWQGFLEKLYITDFNNDGYTDVAACGKTNGGLVFFNNKGKNYFTSNSDSGSFSYVERPIRFSAADMNGDNKIDIVLTNSFVPGMPDTSAMYGEVQINYGGTISYFSYQDSIQGGEFVIGKIEDLQIRNICLADLDNDGDLDIIHVGSPTLISFNEDIPSNVEEAKIPVDFSVSQNYPNPFNPSTSIGYSIPTDGIVTVKVFDMLGREIRTIANDYKNAGSYNVIWDSKGNFGSEVSSGIYFYNIKFRDNSITKKMLMVK